MISVVVTGCLLDFFYSTVVFSSKVFISCKIFIQKKAVIIIYTGLAEMALNYRYLISVLNRYEQELDLI